MPTPARGQFEGGAGEAAWGWGKDGVREARVRRGGCLRAARGRREGGARVARGRSEALREAAQGQREGLVRDTLGLREGGGAEAALRLSKGRARAAPELG